MPHDYDAWAPTSTVRIDILENSRQRDVNYGILA